MFTFILEMRFGFLLLNGKGRQAAQVGGLLVTGNDRQCHRNQCAQIDVETLTWVYTPKIQEKLDSDN